MTERAVDLRFAAKLAAPLLLIFLTACGYTREQIGITQKQLEDQTSFVAISPQQAWVNPSEITMVMERALLGGSEQRVGLRNDVAIEGDNLLVLRTRSGHLSLARFRFEEFLNRVGGAQPPFAGVKSGDLQASEDSLGTYFWTEKTAGSDLTCVFAVRRITSAMRALPGDADVMDVMLRNCIRGSREAALAPVLDQSIGFRRGSVAGEGGTSRMLSPLAAPGLK